MNAMPASPFNSTTEVIFAQMGGWQFARLIGTKAIGSDGAVLKIRFTGKAKSKINLVHVTLMEDDTYSMEFFRASKNHDLLGVKLVANFDDVYNDQLQDIFESTTGLFTSLFPRK